MAFWRRSTNWSLATLTLSALWSGIAGAQTPAGASVSQTSTLQCVAQPLTVSAGEPVNIDARLSTPPNGKKQAVYTWSSTGGRITGTQDGAHIDTAGVAPGDYVVSGRVKDGRGTARNASCTAAFRVVTSAPPTLACSANPPSIVPGGFTTISAVATSPQNRPMTYSYGTTAGQITGAGPTATLAATDVNPGPLRVTCNVVDDRGEAASTAVTIDVRTPPPAPVAPAPEARRLCSASFARDHARPVRVDNEAKGCLDDIALQLTREPTATLVIVGKHEASEKPEAAAERALNMKQYMTDEKRIEGARIQVRTGEISGRTADNVLVPQGASWDPIGTAGFDPGQIQRHGEPYSRDRR